MTTFKDTSYGDMTGQTTKEYIKCNFNALTSLEGAPEVVENTFACSSNRLTSLLHGPKYVSRDYWANSNDLVSLEGGPLSVRGTFTIRDNPTLLKPLDQIVKYNIRAKEYKTDEGTYTWEEVSHLFELNQRVTRPSMRTLLGLKK